MATSGMLIGGKWARGGAPMEVMNKFSGEVIGAVETARPEDVSAAIAAADRAAEALAEMPIHKRSDLLTKIRQLLHEKRELFAKTIAAESGKALKWARAEVDRAGITFMLAAEEARRIHGETIALDAVPAGEGFFGFWVRRPVGVVGAITPFNFPLNLVAHKVAPALAAGCPVVLKPAELTPLTAVLLGEVFQEAGVPDGVLNIIHGAAEPGKQLVGDARVAKISFTGSAEVGRKILAGAGIKKVTLELGNSSPVIVAPDADLDFVAKRCAFGAFFNSGQVCISVQRIYSDQRCAEDFSAKFVKAAEALKVGDPLDEATDVGPMIQEKEAQRIESWVEEARGGGARVRTGGRREKSTYFPTVLTEVKQEMKVVQQEVFAPVASVIACPDFEESLRQANATEYGLQASVFTKDIDRVLRAVKKLNFGGVIVNDMPAFRPDNMPYGGNKQSGLGREGVRFAMEEMSNIQMVAIRTGN